jgi:hypothetical protein
MLDRDTVIGPDDDKGRLPVRMKTEGVDLVLFFADYSGEGDVLEVRVHPDTDAITPAVLSAIGRRFVTYANYARAAIRWDADDARHALEALREAGRTSRGHGESFYRAVAYEYGALVDAGEPHPVKQLGLDNQVTISAASRWVKEARARGYIKSA